MAYTAKHKNKAQKTVKIAAKSEASIRTELGIPTSAERVVIISQSSHMDWDWLETFPVLYDDTSAPYFGASNGTAEEIISGAAALLKPSPPPGSGPNKPSYYYSIAEIGFLERFFSKGPAVDIQTLKAAAKTGLFHLVGGGMTSPDSLLSHGECFIRNSLVAKSWIDQNLPTSTVENCWIPDDFGHDSQLPATLEAMGLAAAAFERLPGGQFQAPGADPLNGTPSMSAQLINNGIDFQWFADDGSKIIGHYLVDGYGQISRQSSGNYNFTSNSDLKNWLDINQPSSPTPYIFIPAGSDFNTPFKALQTRVSDWNSPTSSPPNSTTTQVYAVVATFDHYISLVQAHETNLVKRRFQGAPMWVGNYGSRPALKRWQYNATRIAMGAEAFGVINTTLQMPQSQAWQDLVLESWQLNVASTHHDYVVGTAADSSHYMDVYGVEQLTRLLLARDKANQAREAAMLALTQAITPKLTNSVAYNSETPVAVFNQLGITQSGLTELPCGADHSTLSVRNSYTGTGTGLVQPTHDGSLLFMATAESLGYSTSYLNGDGGGRFPSKASTLSLKSPDNGASWILKNDEIEVTVAKSSNWGITSIKDVTSTLELLKPNTTGNDLVFYADNGSVYRYGSEPSTENPPHTSMVVDNTVKFSDMGAIVTETGPLRVTLETMVEAAVAGQKFHYKRVYSLVLGESMIRMSCSGLAPSGAPNVTDGYSVMTRFALTHPVKRLAYGTPNHWTSAPLVQSWTGPQFLPTHNFLIPLNTDGSQMLGVFHDSMPSWGYDDKHALIGNLFRNNPDSNNNLGAQATDRGIHTQHYALRVPTGLGKPETGQPLREALSFQCPLQGRFVSNLSSETAPESYSAAAIADPSIGTPSPALILGAKPNWNTGSTQTVLRVYQPTNQDLAISMTLGGTPSHQTGLTALEGPLDGPANTRLNLQPSGNGLTFNASRALTTLSFDLTK